MQRWQKELKKFYEEGYRFVPLTAEDLQPESEKVSEAIEKWDEFLSRYASELDTTETTVIEATWDFFTQRNHSDSDLCIQKKAHSDWDFFTQRKLQRNLW